MEAGIVASTGIVDRWSIGALTLPISQGDKVLIGTGSWSVEQAQQIVEHGNVQWLTKLQSRSQTVAPSH
nr:hypothetical protein [Sphingomonas bacterium]